MLLSFCFLAEAAIPYAIQLAVVAIGIGLSYASQYLLKGKAKSSPVQLDNEPTATATRGATLPYLIGRRRVGAIFAWVGSRNAYSAGASSGGGKGSRGRKTHGFSDQLIYDEEGIHLLCVGPAKRLHRIWQDGKQIWPLDSLGRPTVAPIDSTTHPSGSGFTLTNGSNDFFTIYWGEHDQPIDPIVRAAPPLGMGVASRFPYCCYIRWNKGLGTTPRWPLLEYDIETELQYSSLTGSPHSITTGAGLIGVNPAHALDQLLFAPFPYGINQDQTFRDSHCSEQIAASLFDENTPISVFAPNAQTVLATVGSIIQDAGMFYAWDPVEGKFKFRLIRPEATPVAISEDMINDPLPQIEIPAFTKPVDKLIFAFADQDHAFKTSTIGLDDDGQATLLNYERIQQVEMRTVIQFPVATVVAARRSQEMLARAVSYTIRATRGARRLFPGLALSVPSVTSDILRILEVRLDTETGAVELKCVSDFYGASVANAATASPPAGGSQTFSVDPDAAFALLEVPAHVLVTAPETIVVPRIRGSTNMTQAAILLSSDNVTYTNEGNETNLQAGGALTVGMGANDPYEQAQGPTFNAQGPDIGTVLDLSGDEASWRSGKQVALIGDELFFVQKVTALGGSSYRLDGLIRARYDTVRAAHSVGDKVYVFVLDAILQVQDAMLGPNKTVYVKTDPSGLGGSVDVSTVTAVSRALIGKGVTPMPVGALRTIDPRSSFRHGEDIDLKWNYRSAAIPGTGAGMQGAGAGVGTSPIVGYFEISFWTLGLVEKAAYISTTPDFTYGNDALVTDFGSEQSFIVQVRNTNGGWRSDFVQIEVDLV